eukprot:c8360_g1_i4.p1 GENE.c8360_g1_i4~~c8360_g1_i4.p1  ORF type:complete len:298 (-),score=76.95 c8360_g1_i4:67-960(-)
MAMNDLMRRIDTIYVATGGGDDKKKEQQNLDGFRRAKKELHVLLKTVREDIKLRDQMQQENPSGTQTIEKSQKIRKDLKLAKEHASDMGVELEKDKKKKGKAKLAEGELQARTEQLSLAWKHIEECEQLEKRRYTQPQTAPNPQRADLFTKSRKGKVDPSKLAGGASSSKAEASSSATDAPYHPATSSELPDFEIEEQMQQLKQRDKQIDEGLEEISKGVGRLKQVAVAIGDELTLQNEMLNVIETKVDTANEQLLTLNKKMKQTLTKVKGADRFIMNFILLMVVLGIAAYIYSMLK